MTTTQPPERARQLARQFAGADGSPATPPAEERYRRLADFLVRLYLAERRAKRLEGST